MKLITALLLNIFLISIASALRGNRTKREIGDVDIDDDCPEGFVYHSKTDTCFIRYTFDVPQTAKEAEKKCFSLFPLNPSKCTLAEILTEDQLWFVRDTFRVGQASRNQDQPWIGLVYIGYFTTYEWAWTSGAKVDYDWLKSIELSDDLYNGRGHSCYKFLVEDTVESEPLEDRQLKGRFRRYRCADWGDASPSAICSIKRGSRQTPWE